MTYRAGILNYSLSGGGGGSTTWANVTGKPEAFPPEAHTHSIANVTGLQDALDGKADVGHTHPPSDPWTYVKLANNATTTGTANVDTALAFTPPANSVVIFEGQLFLQAAATTTGVRPGIKWPTGGVLQNIAKVESPNSATAAALRFWGNTATANAAATGVAVANEGIFGKVEGTIVTNDTVTGNLIVTLASEVSGSEVRLMANSWLRYRAI